MVAGSKAQCQVRGILVDDEDFPLIAIVYDAAPDAGAVDGLGETLSKLFARASLEGVRVATIADVTNFEAEAFRPEAQRHLFELLGGLDTAYPGVAVCDAVVSTSEAMHAIFRRSGAKWRPGHEMRFFSTLREAGRWASSRRAERSTGL